MTSIDPEVAADPVRIPGMAGLGGIRAALPFHSLRHSSITNVYRATKDLYLTQRFARHASPLSTTVYTHPTDEELYEGDPRGSRT